MTREKQIKKVTINITLINIFLAVIKFLVGIFIGSSVLIADAWHSLTDVITTAFVYFGVTLSGKPADKEHPYGHDKIELIVSNLISLFLLLTGGVIIYNAIKGFNTVVSYDKTTLGIIVVIVSIGANEFMYHYSKNIAKKINSQALVADAWHHRTDSLSSIAALIGLIGVALGYGIVDPIASIIVGLIIIKAGFSIMLSTTKELIDTAPNEQIMEKVKEIINDFSQIEKIDSLKGVFHLNHIDLNIGLTINADTTITTAEKIRNALSKSLRNEFKNVKDVNLFFHPNLPE